MTRRSQGVGRVRREAWFVVAVSGNLELGTWNLKLACFISCSQRFDHVQHIGRGGEFEENVFEPAGVIHLPGLAL